MSLTVDKAGTSYLDKQTEAHRIHLTWPEDMQLTYVLIF